MPRFYYGGQAVMEGVMMRGRQSAAVAIRRPEGDIYLYEEALNSKLYRNKVLRLPFFARGWFRLARSPLSARTIYGCFGLRLAYHRARQLRLLGSCHHGQEML